MKMNNICILIVLLFLSCSNRIAYHENKINGLSKNELAIIKCDSTLVCYKFLYNDDYPVEITEKSFWAYGKVYKEFSYKELDMSSMEDIIKSIKTFEKKETLKDFNYTYAFVKNCKDTVYADYNLNKWIIKVNGKSNYYEYDESSNGKIDTLAIKGLSKYDKFFRY